MADDFRDRVVASRQRLRQRFLDRMAETPGLSDARPQGSGPPNRHGMPRVPVGQTVTEKWPVLDLGQRPYIRKSRWTLEVTGA
ncbi:MAG: sulfite oxidase-like oxidoreductase, partial [Myxococcota bacterium]